MRTPFAALLLCCSLLTTATAQSLKPEQLPRSLQDWLPWAQQGHEAERCPRQLGDPTSEALCIWPARLQLQADARGARFRYTLQIIGAQAMVALPGQTGVWPQQVLLEGKPVAVVEKDERPHLLLPAGRHQVEGSFSWAELPQDLQLPSGLAQLEASLGGRPLRHAPDADGRFWLRGAEGEAGASDSLTQRWLRRLDDGLPLQLHTQIELQIAGKPRELVLPLALLPGWQAATLDSPLPARLLADGSLRVQARAGSWTLSLSARRLAPLDELALPIAAAQEEVWSFAADNAQRVVSLSGLTAIDPSQVEMPGDWRQLPAFRVKPGESLRLATTRRGIAEPAADQLRLSRNLWLDFDGQGWSLRDQLRGSFSRSTRLSLAAPAVLGRADIGGQAQAISRDDQGLGFALRQLQAELSADSRIDTGLRELPLHGWQVELQNWDAHLHLPPGWRLLHVSGVSRAEGSWFERWTLWDLFFVLLAALAAGKLLGWRTGLLLGAALALSWHVDGAPMRSLWLLLLALLGLARVLPAEGAPARGLARARHLLLVLMLALLLPHAVNQVRLAIYPQLETEGIGPVAAAAGPIETKVVEMEVPMPQLQMPAPPRMEKLNPADSYRSKSNTALLSELDPRARVQTGPGLPDWQGQMHALHRDGPVGGEETMRLWLLPPWAYALMRLLALALMAAALWRLAGAPLPAALRRRPQQGRASLGVLLAVALALGLIHQTAQAEEATAPSRELAWPSAEQLSELRQKLNPAPACAPRCAELARAWLSAKGGQLQLRMEVHAQTALALPLPGQRHGFRPTQILLDGSPASARRDADGDLSVLVPAGVSQLLLSMEEAPSSLAIHLPLPLRELRSELSGWTLSGLDARGQVGNALSLQRQETRPSEGKDDGTSRDGLSPLVRVEREFSLGLQWRAQTRVLHVGDSRRPVAVRYRLLAGETVTEGSVQVENGEVQALLGPSDELLINSTLKPQSTLKLQASQQAQQLETWRISASPQWQLQLQAKALAPIAHHDDAGQWRPLWQPWPGEQLQLAVSRPEGVSGQTLTLDSLHTVLSPGAQASEFTQTLQLRSSLGGEHVLRLPPGASLLSLQLNGQALPLQAKDGKLVLPLTPGAHGLELRWRLSEGMGLLYRSATLEHGMKGANETLQIHLPQDRLVLAFGSATPQGPALLFWGALLVLLAAGLLMRRLPVLQSLPLGVAGWSLLALGLAPAGLLGWALLVGWFLLLRARELWAPTLGRLAHNALQVFLLLWTVAALLALLQALHTGLLGHPDLMIAGNGSSNQQLNWFADRVQDQSQSAWIFSLPLWCYRLAMLAWALWLAHALLNWLRWAWASFSSGGLWRSKPQPASAARTDEV